MVATPVQNQTVSVTYGTDGTKIASGKTTPGATDWKTGGNVGSGGVYVLIDTSAAGFTSVPTYVITIGGKSHHWGISGSSSIYNPTAQGFEVEIRWEKGYHQDGTAVTPAIANQNEWHIHWIAIEPSSGQGSGTSTQPSSALPTVGKDYYIVAKHSGKGIAVDGESQNNGANVVQWDITAKDSHKFRLQDAGNGYYYIVAKHSGKGIAVTGERQDNGANIVQWDITAKDHHIFQLQDAGNGYYYIVAKHSGKGIAVNGESQNNGANIVQWDIAAKDHHKWKFQAV